MVPALLIITCLSAFTMFLGVFLAIPKALAFALGDSFVQLFDGVDGAHPVDYNGGVLLGWILMIMVFAFIVLSMGILEILLARDRSHDKYTSVIYLVNCILTFLSIILELCCISWAHNRSEIIDVPSLAILWPILQGAFLVGMIVLSLRIVKSRNAGGNI